MRQRMMWALVALNVLLAIALAARWGGENQALAQARRPAEYIMVHGEVSGGATAVVYTVDATNGMLGAMVYDENSKQINFMPPIDLARVFQTGPAGPAVPAPGGRR